MRTSIQVILLISFIVIFGCSDDDPAKVEVFDYHIDIEYDGVIYDAVLMSDSTFILTGGTGNLFGTHENNVFLLKTDMDGEIIQSQVYTCDGDYTAVKILKSDLDGVNILCQGQMDAPAFSVLKLDSEFNQTEEIVIDYMQNGHIRNVYERSDGYCSVLFEEEPQFKVLVVDQEGELIRELIFDNEELLSADINNNNELLLYTFNINTDKYMMTKVSSDNQVSWTRELDQYIGVATIDAYGEDKILIVEEIDVFEERNDYEIKITNDDGTIIDESDSLPEYCTSIFQTEVNSENEILMLGNTGDLYEVGNSFLFGFDQQLNMNTEIALYQPYGHFYYKMKLFENDDLACFGYGSSGIALLYIPNHVLQNY